MKAFKYFLRFVILLAISTLLHITSVQAQKLLENRFIIALSVSANAYKGDLGDSYEKWTSAYYLSVLLKHQRRLHGSLHFGFGTLTGQASVHQTTDLVTPSPSPNRFFTTQFFTANYGLQYDIIRGQHWTVFLSQGFGIIRFNPQDEFDNDLQDDLQTRSPNESYSNVAVILPTQLGFTYAFSNQFGLGARAGFTNPLTDYLDNVSQLGTKAGNDNMLSFIFSFYAPIGSKAE